MYNSMYYMPNVNNIYKYIFIKRNMYYFIYVKYFK